MADVVVSNEGSLIGFQPLSDGAKDWIKENIPDDAPWLGARFFAEPRYAQNIIDGMISAGLEVQE